MHSSVCEKLDIEFPLLAFSHCRDVVVEVSKAGGMGVLGAANMTPETLAQELDWIDERIDGMPYGVDIIVPNSTAAQDESIQEADMLAMVPEGHKQFARSILATHDVAVGDLEERARDKAHVLGNSLRVAGASRLLEVAFRHPISLIVNALGTPPPVMLEMGKKHDVPVGALVGSKKHAVEQVNAGVDLLIVAGTEAGGHCGEVSTLVLVPEVCEAISSLREVPVLAAGGIVTGRQMAAVMAMGAEGVWAGSVWLTTHEAETSAVVKEKMIRARSNDTVRSRSRTGKQSRQLRSAWTDAWESEGPEPLPMPLQSLVAEPALDEIAIRAQSGHQGAQKLDTYWVGQGVGLMNSSESVRNVVYGFKEDFLTAYERLAAILSD
ncbi:MAG: nitronate monooxygenase [Gammaproteobacteria bacterium]|jgi:NAD(P)H-dependent flavin oxidoreductase YrpB (nitropropane dioxygenase family)|nr:nitronate monooxygenase [Gammaproteobacteria bacterium]